MRREILLAGIVAVAFAAEARAQSGASAMDGGFTDAMAREHAHDAPVPTAAVRHQPQQQVRTAEVVYDTVNGKQVRGFMAWPARGGRNLPAVLMIHEWWGLNDNVKQMAQRLAGEGYRVLAVDMYNGKVATTPEEARTYMQEVVSNSAAGVSNLRSAAQYLRNRQRVTRIGVVGWCFGGAWALQSALLLHDEIDATVMYYGRVVTDRDRLALLDSPLLGLFGGDDRSIPVADVQQMEATLKELGKSVETHVYPGAGHGFANPSGQTHNAQAAEDAWRRTVAFFGQHLQTAAPAAAGSR
jgi:carboxymethylenebutenolidase